ncbi:MAG TPA: transcription antitermination factor NusB [Polyangia bacterium]|nr:transcription antitermination factor NusB [Polyangia bacterium]
MGSRRRAREAALQALYQLDLNPDLTPEQALGHVFETFGRGDRERERSQREESELGRTGREGPERDQERGSPAHWAARGSAADHEPAASAAFARSQCGESLERASERDGQPVAQAAQEGEVDERAHAAAGHAGALEAEQRAFATKLVLGVTRARTDIDPILARASTHWRLDRMAAVDRNLLRLAVYELLYEADIPASVTIDEAVEIAKRYGTAESPAFVNGVLHRVAAEAQLPK